MTPFSPTGRRIKTPQDKNQRLIVFSVAMAVFMVRLDGYIVNISLPTISRYFQVDVGEVSWVVISYLLIMTSSMLIFGKLADKIGLKRIFMGGYVVFTAGSLLCGLSPSIYFLDISRALQGTGSAMMVTSAFAIISRYLPAEQTGWAFGICSFANSLGIMIGAPLGGLITSYLSWNWIFLVNIPVGIVALFIAGRALPYEIKARPDNLRFDWAGSVLSIIALSLFVFSLSMGNEMGWTSSPILCASGSSLLAFMAFIRQESAHPDPILDFSMFKKRNFAFAIMTTLLAVMLLSGGNFLLPFYLEIVKGLKSDLVGGVILIYSIVYMPIGLFSGRLSDRINPVIICSSAILLTAISCGAFASTLSLSGLLPPILFLVLLAVAYGFFFAANHHLVMSLAPVEP
ncbi:MAG: DHA2 family efflux MFS transporter permease subunit, partial [Syntrophales bacterium]|nr:DHA2 family efflux MFS transporter permease subunit [Syntrophales bacterium]